MHRVQRVPATEQMGRVHTSTASVVVLRDVDQVCELECVTARGPPLMEPGTLNEQTDVQHRLQKNDAFL